MCLARNGIFVESGRGWLKRPEIEATSSRQHQIDQICVHKLFEYMWSCDLVYFTSQCVSPQERNSLAGSRSLVLAAIWEDPASHRHHDSPLFECLEGKQPDSNPAFRQFAPMYLFASSQSPHETLKTSSYCKLHPSGSPHIPYVVGVEWVNSLLRSRAYMNIHT